MLVEVTGIDAHVFVGEIFGDVLSPGCAELDDVPSRHPERPPIVAAIQPPDIVAFELAYGELVGPEGVPESDTRAA